MGAEKVLTRNKARLIFTMSLVEWPDGTPVRVFVLPDHSTLHKDFSKHLLGLYPRQLRRVWDRKLYTGTGQVPVVVRSEQEMLQRIADTPGAIGYLSNMSKRRGIHVLRIKK